MLVNDLATPGLRIPLTVDGALFAEAAELSRRVVWLHTFGERMADTAADRPPGPPRLPPEQRPEIPVGGTIPSDADRMPDSIDYGATQERLRVGDRRPPSPLGDIQPDAWQAEYTTELLKVINVLGLLVALEPAQSALLNCICSSTLFDTATLLAAGAFASQAGVQRRARRADTSSGTARLEGFG